MVATQGKKKNLSFWSLAGHHLGQVVEHLHDNLGLGPAASTLHQDPGLIKRLALGLPGMHESPPSLKRTHDGQNRSYATEPPVQLRLVL